MPKKNSFSNSILITGGAGYIGSLLTAALAKKGHNVKVYDQFYFGKEPLQHLNGFVTRVKGDIRNLPNDLFENVSSVIHLAGLSNDPTAEFNPKANFEINTEATVRLANAAKKSGVKRFIFASSASIYDLGLEKKHNMKNEKSKVNPKAAYSLSKRKAEKSLLKFSDKNFCVTSLRKGTVFGFSPRMRYDLVVNTMVKNALSKGKIIVFCKGLQWRPLVDISDAVSAYELALEAPFKKINGEIINISLDNFLMKDLANIVQKTLKKYFGLNINVLFEQDDRKDRSYKVSTEKAKKLLGFSPKRSIEESVIDLVKKIQKGIFNDFENPLYYNIRWMQPILKNL